MRNLLITAFALAKVCFNTGCEKDSDSRTGQANDRAPAQADAPPVDAPAAQSNDQPTVTNHADGQTHDAQVKRGKMVFLLCRSCHTLEENEPHLTGPNLYGLFGAVAGEKEGYGFSSALSESDLKWTRDTLDPWLKEPANFLPGNRMAFAGIPSDDDRAAVISYLEQTTQ